MDYYHPDSISDKVFEAAETGEVLEELVVRFEGDGLVFTDVSVDSTVGEGRGKYAMVSGMYEENEFGLRISTMRSDGGDVIDVVASGNVANPYLFDKERVPVARVTAPE